MNIWITRKLIFHTCKYITHHRSGIKIAEDGKSYCVHGWFSFTCCVFFHLIQDAQLQCQWYLLAWVSSHIRLCSAPWTLFERCHHDGKFSVSFSDFSWCCMASEFTPTMASLMPCHPCKFPALLGICLVPCSIRISLLLGLPAFEKCYHYHKLSESFGDFCRWCAASTCSIQRVNAPDFQGVGNRTSEAPLC